MHFHMGSPLYLGESKRINFGERPFGKSMFHRHPQHARTKRQWRSVLPGRSQRLLGWRCRGLFFGLLFASERSCAKAPTVYPMLGEKEACATVSLHLHLEVPATAVAVRRLRGFLWWNLPRGEDYYWKWSWRRTLNTTSILLWPHRCVWRR